jgi:hypothetical protein
MTTVDIKWADGSKTNVYYSISTTGGKCQVHYSEPIAQALSDLEVYASLAATKFVLNSREFYHMLTTLVVSRQA